jgi:type I restriction-modification system DNA methylase subunit
MVSQEEAKQALNTLVATYEKHKEDKEFIKNERQISQSLIIPFFHKVLGWDVTDPSEFKTEYSQNGKRIDYLVCLDDISQFVIEAKALSHDIRENPGYYNQAIQYAHSKDRKFAILTNFKHFIILECDIRVDNPLKAQIRVIDITNLAENDFDILLSFSKDVWAKSGESNPAIPRLNLKKRAKIDEELLEDMKRWRESLLTNIKKHSRANTLDFSDPKELEYIEEEVQRFIDRLIFICFCEDKSLEENRLKSLLIDKRERFSGRPFLLGKIRELFAEYRKVYNSDLFDEKGHCDTFFIDDAVLYNILKDLREPENRPFPYDFSIIEADILGRVYENFIGHLTSGKKRFKEKESKGKRKEQGIYYTPTYIVDYIVKNTLGELIKNKSLDELRKIKVLDPACGSGSFLIKAFQVLDSYYEKKSGYPTDFKKNDILKDNIFGVDLDPKAVEIARFNLMLRAARKHHKLPMLNNNIKCGNSLIDDPSVAGDKAFTWEDQFKDIMQEGGFDVIIGNPPWVFTRGEHFSGVEKKYFDDLLLKRQIIQSKKGKNIQSGKLNLYSLFTLRGIDLMKNRSFFGFIIPNNILRTTTYDVIRKYILDKCRIISIVDLSTRIFEGVTASSIILILEKENNKKTRDENDILIVSEISDLLNKEYKTHKIKQKCFYENTSYTFNILSNLESTELNKKIEHKTEKLGSLCKYIIEGIVGSLDKDVSDKKINNLYKPLLVGKDIKRYRINYKRRWICYDKNRLHRARPEEVFLSQKILIQRISGGASPLAATYDEDKYYSFASLNNLVLKENINYDIRYILALINSKLLNWYYSTNFSNKSELTVNVSKTFLEQLPIKIVPESQQQPLIKLVDKILSLNKHLNEIGDKRTDERTRVEEEIKKTDAEIDELVYKIYGLTEEEKKIIEESLK